MRFFAQLMPFDKLRALLFGLQVFTLREAEGRIEVRTVGVEPTWDKPIRS
jgi:hypothetical protein